MRKLLILVSVSGFIWQVFVVSIEYFGYKTTTSVAFKLLPHVKPQTSVLCVRYREVMDRERIAKETEIKVPPALDDHEEKLRVNQIFKYTPHPERVIKSCLVPDKRGYLSSKSTKCAQFFNVSKYFTQEYMCYRFFMKEKHSYPIEVITHSTTNSFLVYEVILTPEFRDVSVVEAIVHPDDGGYPTLSRDYGAKHVIRLGDMGRNDQNYLFLSGSDIVANKLEKPYDTACVHISKSSGYRCLLPCKSELYRTINRVPAAEVITQPEHLKAISDAERRDPEIRSKLQSFDQTCRQKCIFSWCHTALSITASLASRNPNASFGFSVNTAKQPDLHSKSLPIMTFIEYFSFVAGCFGTWFGVSFLSLDLRKICHRKHVSSRH